MAGRGFSRGSSAFSSASGASAPDAQAHLRGIPAPLPKRSRSEGTLALKSATDDGLPPATYRVFIAPLIFGLAPV